MAAAQTPRAERLRAHTRVLAHDSMEGRGTATAGEVRAGLYIARQLRDLGLEPLKAGGPGEPAVTDYLLPVPLMAHRLDTGAAMLRVRSAAGEDTLRPPAFYHPGGSTGALRDFAGGLLVAGPTPGAVEALAGHPALTGRVVVLGPPWDGLEDVLAALRDRGAEGVIEAVPTEFYHRLRVVRGPIRYSLAEEAGQAGPPAIPEVVIGPGAIAALGLQDEIPPPGSGPGYAEARPLDARVEVRAGMSAEPVTGHNVAAVLPAGPSPAEGAVVLVAHYDHVGFGEPAGVDSIWNGFADNAAGAAVVLEAARALAAEPPDRTVVFLLTTGEEQGLLGAEHFVRQPPATLPGMRAVVNIDGGFPPADIREWTIAAPAGTALRTRAVTALEQTGWDVVSRPVISDSDHWAFHRAGIPALFLYPGRQAPGIRAHTPGDEWRADLRFDGLARYVDAAVRVARALAAAP